MSVEVYGRELDEVELNEMFYQETGILKRLDNLKIFNWLKWERDCLEINRSLKKLGLKHLPNPERLWRAVSEVYTEEWLKKNWGEIKPVHLENIKSLSSGDSNRPSENVEAVGSSFFFTSGKSKLT